MTYFSARQPKTPLLQHFLWPHLQCQHLECNPRIGECSSDIYLTLARLGSSRSKDTIVSKIFPSLAVHLTFDMDKRWSMRFQSCCGSSLIHGHLILKEMVVTANATEVWIIASAVDIQDPEGAIKSAAAVACRQSLQALRV